MLAYAVLDATRACELPAVRGPGDAQLKSREVAGLRVVYSRCGSLPATPDLEQLRAFYGVLEGLHVRYDILPLRWGQFFAHPQALTRAIAADAALYAQRLARLVGRTEMGIRFLPTATQTIPEAALGPASDSPGRTFLEQRRARYGLDAALVARQRRVEELCRASFAGLFHELESETAPGQGPDAQAVILVYFLIARALVARFRHTYADLEPCQDGRMLLTGPWPPFNFAV